MKQRTNNNVLHTAIIQLDDMPKKNKKLKTKTLTTKTAINKLTPKIDYSSETHTSIIIKH